MFVSDEGRICLGCWGLCFGSDEGDTVDSVLVVVVFLLSRYVLFFWVWFYSVSLSSVSRQNIQLDIFQKVPCLSTSFIFDSLILVFFGGVFSWLCFDLNVFRFASFFADFFMDFLDFVVGAQMRCARCFVYMEASLWLLSPAADRLTNAHKIRWVLLAACVALWTSQRIKKS